MRESELFRNVPNLPAFAEAANGIRSSPAPRANSISRLSVVTVNADGKYRDVLCWTLCWFVSSEGHEDLECFRCASWERPFLLSELPMASEHIVSRTRKRERAWLADDLQRVAKVASESKRCKPAS